MSVITKIEKQKNKLDRVNIYLDEEFYCAMQNFVCVKHGLFVGKKVSKEHLTNLMFESDKERAMNKVAKYLGYGIKTKKQITDYLIKQGYDNQLQNYVIEKLTEYNYINDLSYAKTYIQSYKRKYGRRKIEYELYKKGLSKEDIEVSMQDFESDEDDLLALAKKHFKNKEQTAENFQKTSAYLASKGFGWSEISKAVNSLKQELKESE